VLAALPMDAKQRLFAWCVASCLKPQLAIEDRADPAIECAGWRLAIPFADCWRPTAANYWGRVKKAHGLAIGAELLGERWARDHAGDKARREAMNRARKESASVPPRIRSRAGSNRSRRPHHARDHHRRQTPHDHRH
jgi:ParB family chromosome partitioning protein